MIGDRCAGRYRSAAGEQRGPQREGPLPQRFAVGRAAKRKTADGSGHTKAQMVSCHARDDRAGKAEHCGNDLRNIRALPQAPIGERRRANAVWYLPLASLHYANIKHRIIRYNSELRRSGLTQVNADLFRSA